MSYEAPEMQVAAITTDTAVANEIEVDFSKLISKDIPAQN